MSSLNPQSALHVAGQFYDAATGIGSWGDALDTLCNLAQFPSITFEQHSLTDGRLLDMHSSGIEERSLSDYVEHYYAVCPRHDFLMYQPAGTVGYDAKVISKDQVKHDTFYQEFLRPIDLQFFLSATIENNAGFFSVIAMQRSASQGHATQSEIETLGTLIPTITRALQLRRRFGELETKSKGYEAVFQRLQTGIVLLDPQGGVEFINESALDSIADSSQINVTRSELEFTHHSARKRYRRALHNLSSSESMLEGSSEILLSRSDDGGPLRLNLLPLPGSCTLSKQLTGTETRKMLVVIHDSTKLGDPPAEMLKIWFGLTPREAELATALANGETVKDFGDRLEIGLTTVRSHLASLRSKLGARSQGDVIRIVLRLISPHIC